MPPSGGSSGSPSSPEGSLGELTQLTKLELCERLVELIADEVSDADPSLGLQSWALDQHLELVEEVFLRRALKHSDGNRTEAARLLGISFRSIRYRLKKLKANQGEL